MRIKGSFNSICEFSSKFDGFLEMALGVRLQTCSGMGQSVMPATDLGLKCGEARAMIKAQTIVLAVRSHL